MSRLSDAWHALTGPRPARSPYRLDNVVGNQDRFTLTATYPEGPAATRAEAELRGAILQRVNWYFDTPADQRHVTQEYVTNLREIATRGLAAADGNRDFVAQKRSFDQLYNSVTPAAAPAGTASPVGHDMTGSFTVDLDVDGEIQVKRVPGGKLPSDDQRAFVDAMAALERLVVQLYTRTTKDLALRQARLANVRERLKWAGQIGLEGAMCDFRLARTALDGIEADALQDCGARVRSCYLRDLAVRYAVIGVVALAFVYAWHVLIPRYPPLQVLQISDPGLAYLSVATAAMFCGAWLSAASRLEPSDKGVLLGLLGETFSYWVRALFVLGFGWFALLLLHKQVVYWRSDPTARRARNRGSTRISPYRNWLVRS